VASGGTPILFGVLDDSLAARLSFAWYLAENAENMPTACRRRSEARLAARRHERHGAAMTAAEISEGSPGSASCTRPTLLTPI